MPGQQAASKAQSGKKTVDTSLMEDDVLVNLCYDKVMESISSGDLKSMLRTLIVRIRNDALARGSTGRK